jgi:hypothetical protein
MTPLRATGKYNAGGDRHPGNISENSGVIFHSRDLKKIFFWLAEYREHAIKFK